MGSVRLAYLHTNRLLIKLYKQETEICCKKDNGFIKTQTDIHRHGPVQPSNICQLLDPPHFSLVTTFKKLLCYSYKQKIDYGYYKFPKNRINEYRRGHLSSYLHSDKFEGGPNMSNFKFCIINFRKTE